MWTIGQDPSTPRQARRPDINELVQNSLVTEVKIRAVEILRDEDIKRSRALHGKNAMHTQLKIDGTTLARFCERHRIRRLSLFGSRLKGTAKPGSDIDLLVEFDPDAVPTLLDIAEMEQQLSDLLGGEQVDLRTAEDLSRYFRADVLRTAEVQYAR